LLKSSCAFGGGFSISFSNLLLERSSYGVYEKLKSISCKLEVSFSFSIVWLDLEKYFNFLLDFYSKSLTSLSCVHMEEGGWEEK
jgi:hypothetical protein